MAGNDDIKQRREELKGKLLRAFNSVSGDKVVKVDDLIRNFKKEDDKYFVTAGFLNPARIGQKIEESVAEGQIEKLAKNAPPKEDGVYVSAEGGGTAGSAYVSVDFLKRNMIKAIDSGQADSYFGAVEKAGYATVDAIKDSADQSARVQGGQLRPTKPKAPGS